MGVLKEMGIELTKKQVTELYFVLDRDGDGEIDTKELLRGYEDVVVACLVVMLFGCYVVWLVGCCVVVFLCWLDVGFICWFFVWLFGCFIVMMFCRFVVSFLVIL